MIKKLEYIEQLRSELKNAYTFKNSEKMWSITNRLLTVYAELADELSEKIRKANSGHPVRTPIGTTIKVTEDPPVHLNCPHGFPRGY